MEFLIEQVLEIFTTQIRELEMSLHIGIVYPSGKDRQTENEKKLRIEEWKKAGFKITDFVSAFASPNDITSAPVLERAALFSHAITNRKIDIVIGGRGGYGVTELIPYLDLMLPPAIGNKTFVGFSDNSYLGVYLSLKYSNFRYIHAKHAFSSELFLEGNTDTKVLFELFQNQKISNEFTCNSTHTENKKIEGICIPLNLSLAESLAATKNVVLPQNTILFLEDLHEYVYQMLRKFDSLILSGILNNVSAIVLGEFTKPLRNNDEEMPRAELLEMVSERLQKPVIDFPFFGHNKSSFPLVAHSVVKIDPIAKNKVTLDLSSEMPKRNSLDLESPKEEKIKNIHLSGIGGTGMASVAGLLSQGGYSVSGSDKQKIYPPMDKVLDDLKITPDIGYKSENITTRKIDAVVLGNAMSRTTATLEQNEELNAILQTRMPMMSFPSALRKLFLKDSFNIIISGTHGKTSTSSLCAFLLDGLGENPSYLIGGMPGNFESGFRLGNKKLFVLEADEYDSALFDKGPKFLHYEPSVTLINNIEYDHADIYDSVESIEAEFLRLAMLTKERNGLNVINWSDKRVKCIAEKLSSHCVVFDSKIHLNSNHKLDKNLNNELNDQSNENAECSFPKWTLNSFETKSNGIEVHFSAPDTSKHSLFVQQMFGAHNALNTVAIIASFHAKSILEGKTLEEFISSFESIANAAKKFKGIKRRFEFLMEKNEIVVFEDFAHHPTAVETTLKAFKEYMSLTGKTGRLIVCFDPHNATLRRNTLQSELAKSFSAADLLFLGKIPEDLRTDKSLMLDGAKVVEECKIPGKYYFDNEKLLEAVHQEAKPCDTIVFMSSGSFDGIIHKFLKLLENEG